MRDSFIEQIDPPVISNKDVFNSPNSSALSSFNPQDAYDQINDLFNEQDKQAKDIQETREILEDSAQDLTDAEVYNLSNSVQHLVDCWLEDYERKVFHGKTLDELLGEQE